MRTAVFQGIGLLFALTTPALAATITVDVASDEFATGGDCGIREAIEAANVDLAVDGCPAGSGDDLIVFAPSLDGTTLVIGATLPATEDANQAGDLDVHDNLTIRGNGTGVTLFTGAPEHSVRVFDVHSSVTLTLENLTIRDTFVDGLSGNDLPEGGGVRASSATTLVVRRCSFSNNAVLGLDAAGAAISAAAAAVTIEDSSFTENAVGTDSQGSGGAIHVQDGNLAIVRSTVTDNEVEKLSNPKGDVLGNTFGGGVAHFSSGEHTLTIVDSVIARNTSRNDTAEAFGGNVFAQGGSGVIERSEISEGSVVA